MFIGKGADRYLLTSYERDVIRPHALGKFEDLLVATAQSPAMLFYLDNWLNWAPIRISPTEFPGEITTTTGATRHGRGVRPAETSQGQAQRAERKLWARVDGVAHLGVNGGYTQTDVTEVARPLTGWTVKQPKQCGGSISEERMHTTGRQAPRASHRITWQKKRL